MGPLLDSIITICAVFCNMRKPLVKKRCRFTTYAQAQALKHYTAMTRKPFHITDPLWGKYTGDFWIPFTKGQWCRSSIMSLKVAWKMCWTQSEATGDLIKIATSLLPLPWASSLPVAIQCAWNLDPSVHWNATGEMPACFQWSSSGFPVVFQCVPIMQINTGSPLGHGWVLASASVVPVASQRTCGSSGLPACSNYAN